MVWARPGLYGHCSPARPDPDSRCFEIRSLSRALPLLRQHCQLRMPARVTYIYPVQLSRFPPAAIQEIRAITRTMRLGSYRRHHLKNQQVMSIRWGNARSVAENAFILVRVFLPAVQTRNESGQQAQAWLTSLLWYHTLLGDTRHLPYLTRILA